MERTHCKKSATQTSSGCKNCPRLPDHAPIVHYCGAECQKADWGNHEPTCHRLRDRQ
ncbi:hypothetical protein BDZ45DRAFT_674751 [Acephala macrosclerotiorum]|nr:hypothetical protein BDZ45DRAFT_674751 [Acephala macrosclerotiorum]